MLRYAEICWASDATTHLLILNWSLKWSSQALVKTVKTTWKSSETLAAFVLVLIFVCRSHLGNLGSNTTWTPTKMTKRFFTHTHTPEMPMYPGISRDIQGIQLAKSTVWTPHWMVCATQRVYRVYFFLRIATKLRNIFTELLNQGPTTPISQSPWPSSSDFLRFYKIHAQAQNPKWSKWGQLNQLPNTPKIICVQVPHIPHVNEDQKTAALFNQWVPQKDCCSAGQKPNVWGNSSVRIWNAQWLQE